MAKREKRKTLIEIFDESERRRRERQAKETKEQREARLLDEAKSSALTFVQIVRQFTTTDEADLAFYFEEFVRQIPLQMQKAKEMKETQQYEH